MKFLGLLLFSITILGPLPAQKAVYGGAENLAPFGPLLTKVLGSAGIDATLIFEPQARLVYEEGRGILDGIFFLTDTAIAGVPGLVKVPVPLYRNEVVAVAAQPGVKIKSEADLARYSVGIVRGNTAHETLARGAGRVVPAENEAQLFRMLALKRFDAAVLARVLVPSAARESGIQVWYIQEPPLLVQPLYFCLAPKGTGELSRVTAAFRKEVDSGAWAREVEEILESRFR